MVSSKSLLQYNRPHLADLPVTSTRLYFETSIIENRRLQPTFAMSVHADVAVYRHYCPPGVKRVIATGTSAFIGVVDESTVLKYPLSPRDVSRLEVARKLLKIVGPHPRYRTSYQIVRLPGKTSIRRWRDTFRRWEWRAL